ncbi:MAG: hypothetical protein ACLS9F_18500 [Clostridium paraputrificum]
MKKFRYLILVMSGLIILSLIIISNSSKIQNPFIGLKAIVSLEIGNEKVEKISEEPLRYISKSYEDFKNYMEDQGYIVEQAGRSFHLEKNSKKILLFSEGFLGIYQLFSDDPS